MILGSRKQESQSDNYNHNYVVEETLFDIFDKSCERAYYES